MYKRHELGKVGEEISKEYLSKIGYEIIERNFSCKQGEIDIIAQDKDEIVFIEVKTRSSFIYGKPVDAVNANKQKHIVMAAKYYVFKNKLENRYIRFDIIEVYKKNNKFKINHFKQVIE